MDDFRKMRSHDGDVIPAMIAFAIIGVAFILAVDAANYIFELIFGFQVDVLLGAIVVIMAIGLVGLVVHTVLRAILWATNRF